MIHGSGVMQQFGVIQVTTMCCTCFLFSYILFQLSPYPPSFLRHSAPFILYFSISFTAPKYIQTFPFMMLGFSPIVNHLQLKLGLCTLTQADLAVNEPVE